MADKTNTRLLDFCRKLPKAELHAHLTGSISVKTVAKLMKLHKAKHQNNENTDDYETWMSTVEKGQQRTLDEIFLVFGIIQKLVDSDDAVFLVTKDVIKEFRDDNVLYLELRSTPRDVASTGMTKRSYIEAILAGIRESTHDGVTTRVRLLLTVDRRVSLEVAMEIVNLAEEYRESSGGVVIGVDLGGDPKVDSTKLLPALQKARAVGLKIAVHLAEVVNMPDDEALIKFKPDRAGHLTFLHPEVGGSQKLVSLIQEYKIPLELCLTSNVLCKTVKNYDNHQFKFWYNSHHPVTIGTDDKGVFVNSLSEEYMVAAETFQLNREDLWNLSYGTIAFIFDDDSVKEKLREAWNQCKGDMGLSSVS